MSYKRAQKITTITWLISFSLRASGGTRLSCDIRLQNALNKLLSRAAVLRNNGSRLAARFSSIFTVHVRTCMRNVVLFTCTVHVIYSNYLTPGSGFNHCGQYRQSLFKDKVCGEFGIISKFRQNPQCISPLGIRPIV